MGTNVLRILVQYATYAILSYNILYWIVYYIEDVGAQVSGPGHLDEQRSNTCVCVSLSLSIYIYIHIHMYI